MCIRAYASGASLYANMRKVCFRQRRVQVEALQGLLSQMQTAGVGHPDGLGPHSRAAVGAAAAGAALGGPTLPTQAQDDGAAESTKPGLDVVLSEFTRIDSIGLASFRPMSQCLMLAANILGADAFSIRKNTAKAAFAAVGPKS